jgi:hypothetical protein
MREHRIFSDYGGERPYWECSCGAAGSVGQDGDLDLASDKHIEPGESRVDVSRLS